MFNSPRKVVSHLLLPFFREWSNSPITTCIWLYGAYSLSLRVSTFICSEIDCLCYSHLHLHQIIYSFLIESTYMIHLFCNKCKLSLVTLLLVIRGFLNWLWEQTAGFRPFFAPDLLIERAGPFSKQSPAIVCTFSWSGGSGLRAVATVVVLWLQDLALYMLCCFYFAIGSTKF
jgi:hypothetical protein